jgi:hypothetical protein
MNNGKWTPEEEKRLIMAVHEVGRPSLVGGTADEAHWVVSAGKWREVAGLVKTRSEKQCRLKWAEVVKASISVGTENEASSSRTNGVAEWGTEEDAQLLSTLSKVMNNPHSEFKTSSLEAADFGALGHSSEHSTREVMIAAAAAAATTAPTR